MQVIHHSRPTKTRLWVKHAIDYLEMILNKQIIKSMIQVNNTKGYFNS